MLAILKKRGPDVDETEFSILNRKLVCSRYCKECDAYIPTMGMAIGSNHCPINNNKQDRITERYTGVASSSDVVDPR